LFTVVVVVVVVGREESEGVHVAAGGPGVGHPGRRATPPRRADAERPPRADRRHERRRLCDLVDPKAPPRRTISVVAVDAPDAVGLTSVLDRGQLVLFWF